MSAVQDITGATRLVALLGNPLSHSLSPAIHNRVYGALGLPFVYVPLVVDKQHLHGAVFGLRASSFAGANVTIPHKQAVMPYCDVLSPLSQLTGTVNTLYMRDGLMHGTTTDWDGFSRALSWMRFELRGSRVVILGNGGTARTFAFALAARKIPETLVIAGRNEAKVSGLAAEISEKTGYGVGHELFSSPGLKTALDRASLCVNCTSVGMYPDVSASPLDASLLHKGLTVFDTIYNPGETMLCRLAKKAGCFVQGGLRMLVFQALASCKFWTGVDVPDDIVSLEELETIVAANNAQGETPK
jgi:shikimate dehydrogenase